jgi:hypothetical protein
MLEDFYPDPDNAGASNTLGRQVLGRLVLGRRFPLATPPFLPGRNAPAVGLPSQVGLDPYGRYTLGNGLGRLANLGRRIPLDEAPPSPAATRGIQAAPPARITGLAPQLGNQAQRPIDLETGPSICRLVTLTTTRRRSRRRPLRAAGAEIQKAGYAGI